MKSNTMTIALCLLTCQSFAQQNTVASGGNASGTGGSFSYSVGQVDYINSSGSNGNVHEGVQQPYEFFKEVGLNEQDKFVAAIYPNPSSDVIVVETDQNTDGLRYVLVDLSGKTIGANDITGQKTEIDVSGLATGQYILKISSASSIIESIKIVKH